MRVPFKSFILVVTAIHLAVGLALFAWHRLARPAPADETGYEVVGPGDSADNSPTAPANNPSPAAAKTHVVASGESYWQIARKYGVSLDDLLAANNHSSDRILRAGEKLLLPAN